MLVEISSGGLGASGHEPNNVYMSPLTESAKKFMFFDYGRWGFDYLQKYWGQKPKQPLR